MQKKTDEIANNPNSSFIFHKISMEGQKYQGFRKCSICKSGLQEPADCVPRCEERIKFDTCKKYSSDILLAHSMHRSRGRQGLATSAHFISMRLMKVRFSGVDRSEVDALVARFN